MQIFAHDGTTVFEGTWTGITAARGVDTCLLHPPKDATHWVRYTTGATAALVAGEVIHGETSGATATLVAQAVESGTAGSSDTGIIFLKDISSTAFEAEVLHGDTTDGHVTIAQVPIVIRGRLANPKALLITVETAAIHMSCSGMTPTATAGTNHGVEMSAGTNRVIRGVNNIENFKAINAVNASGAILKYELMF